MSPAERAAALSWGKAGPPEWNEEVTTAEFFAELFSVSLVTFFLIPAAFLVVLILGLGK